MNVSIKFLSDDITRTNLLNASSDTGDHCLWMSKNVNRNTENYLVNAVFKDITIQQKLSETTLIFHDLIQVRIFGNDGETGENREIYTGRKAEKKLKKYTETVLKELNSNEKNFLKSKDCDVYLTRPFIGIPAIYNDGSYKGGIFVPANISFDGSLEEYKVCDITKSGFHHLSSNPGRLFHQVMATFGEEIGTEFLNENGYDSTEFLADIMEDATQYMLEAVDQIMELVKNIKNVCNDCENSTTDTESLFDAMSDIKGLADAAKKICVKCEDQVIDLT